MEDQNENGKAPSRVPGSPAAPEIGIIWSLLLTPIAGAIFWAVNWKRLGHPKHRWWTILTGVLVVVVYYAMYVVTGNIWIGLILSFAWDGMIYGLQKRVTPQGVRSIGAWVFVGIFAVLSIGLGVYTMRPESSGGVGSSLTIGTSVNKNSPTLQVSGTDYISGKTLYARVYDSRPFHMTSILFLLQKQVGSGWQQVFNTPTTVSPQDNVEVEPFYVTQPGTYQLQVIDNNSVVAETTFNVN